MPMPVAFLGLFVGGWKLLVVAAAVVAFAARSNSRFRPFLRLLRPYTGAARPASSSPTASSSGPAAPGRVDWGTRLYWSLTIVAAAAVAAWIATRSTILAGHP